MKFNDHSALNGAHAFLSASKYHWLNYSSDKLVETFRTAQAAAKGTRLHELAAEHIRLKMRMPRNKVTFNNYVNDAIGFRMTPEQVLFYSINCFGTADAISFDKGLLRIHDLKTGTHPAKMPRSSALSTMSAQPRLTMNSGSIRMMRSSLLIQRAKRSPGLWTSSFNSIRSSRR